jgi:hypothetical protein
MLTPTGPPPTEQLTALLTTFGLTTAAEEIVPRLTQAGRAEIVPLLVEVFDAEAEARRQRRICMWIKARSPALVRTRSSPRSAQAERVGHSVPRLLRPDGRTLFASERRNTIRSPPYLRLDTRQHRTFFPRPHRVTVFGGRKQQTGSALNSRDFNHRCPLVGDR